MAEIFFLRCGFPSKMISFSTWRTLVAGAKTVSELRKHNGFQDLSVLDVYRNPTIEKLAQQLMVRQATSEARHPGTASNKRHETSWFRHVFCGVLQFFKPVFCFWVQPDQGPDVIRCVLLFILQRVSVSGIGKLALLSSIASYPMLITIAITAKWIVLGRIKPGSYPLWGNFYLRWWFIRNCFNCWTFTI